MGSHFSGLGNRVERAPLAETGHTEGARCVRGREGRKQEDRVHWGTPRPRSRSPLQNEAGTSCLELRRAGKLGALVPGSSLWKHKQTSVHPHRFSGWETHD